MYTEEKKMTKVVAGIDVGKFSLDVSVDAGSVRRFSNTHKGIIALENWLKRIGVSLAVCEPTGGYERQLVSILRKGVVEVCRVHPNRVRAFSRACGYEAKTDSLDAKILSVYGQSFMVRPECEHEPERASFSSSSAGWSAFGGAQSVGQGHIAWDTRVRRATHPLAG